MIAKMTLMNLYLFLFFALIKGLFNVSAGANKIKLIKQIIENNIKNQSGKSKFVQISGIPIKEILEVIQHHKLFEA